MARPAGSVGGHRHRAQVIFARYGKDPLEELMKLADDPSLSAERRIQLWLDLMPYLYPRQRSIVVEHAAFTFADLMALPSEALAELSRGCQQFLDEHATKLNEPIQTNKRLPLPTCAADLARYR